MSIDERLLEPLSDLRRERELLREEREALRKGGPGDTSGGMDQRVTRLETHMEYVRRDLDEIKAGQAALLTAVQELKSEVISTKGSAAGKVTVISTGIAIVAIILGVLAFGGDRFSQGMEVAAAAEAARSSSAEPWRNDPVVDASKAPWDGVPIVEPTPK